MEWPQPQQFSKAHGHDPAGCQSYLLYRGINEDEHFSNLEEVFAQLKKHGFWLKKVVGYLGHQIDSEGVKAKLRPLSNVQELRSFLGLLNYYGKFIKNLSSILHPLDQSCEEIFRLRQGVVVNCDFVVSTQPESPVLGTATISAVQST